MAHHQPGERVISQNEPVLDEDDEFIDKVHCFFIMTGNYKVHSLMFEMNKKRKDAEANMAADNFDESVSLDQSKGRKKGLRSGDMFGEVSLLFGCRRTATVKAKQYCEAAYLESKDFLQLMATRRVLKDYLIRNIMKTYDDELRIFLVTCLKKVDYLQNLPEEILVHISMQMVAE